jgi:twitching motility two-component system response regulator PilH
MEQKRILIIDDDRNSVVALRDVLMKAGYAVASANDKKEGLERMKECKPHLILLDLVLPDQSGFKIAQEIKGMPEFSDTPIVAISLKRESVDKHVAVKSGIVEYIEKPVDHNRLLFILRDILQ